MTDENEQRKNGAAKGFAGLSSLVSDVDDLLSPAKESAPQISPESVAGQVQRVPPPVPSPQRPRPSQEYQPPSQSGVGSSGTKWFLGIAAVISVVWFVNASNQRPSSSSPAYRPAQETSTSYSAPAPEPARPREDRPPVGQNHVLTLAQITYCFAEDIRLQGANAAVNGYISTQVNRYNALVNDYNSRCGSYRYRSGTLESARRAVEPYRSQLLAEGRSRF